jgi:hypothetical protein
METINNKTAPIVHEKERNQVTLELMRRMRLTGMANAFMESLSATYAEAMTPVESTEKVPVFSVLSGKY